MMLPEFLAAISEAEYVYFDQASELFFAWNGSQTVNVWVTGRLKELAYFDNSDVFMDDWKDQPDPVGEVKLSIAAYLKAVDA